MPLTPAERGAVIGKRHPHEIEVRGIEVALQVFTRTHDDLPRAIGQQVLGCPPTVPIALDLVRATRLNSIGSGFER